MNRVIGIAHGTRMPAALSERAQKTVYWVKKPASNSAQELRANLLHDHFGLSAKEIEEFVRLTGFFLGTAPSPKREGTTTEVAGWNTDRLGRVEITMSDVWIQKIQNFRVERADRELLRAAAGIPDPLARQVFIACIRGILTLPSADRQVLFNDLVNYFIASQVPRQRFIAAVEAVEQSGYQDNPYLALAKARIALEDYKQLSGPGYDTTVQGYVNEAIRRVNANDFDVASNTGITRADAANINRRAQFVYTGLGDDEGALQRDWMQRFLSMSATERAAYEEGDLVYINAPGETSMRAPNQTKAERDDAALEERWALRNEREAQLAGMGPGKPRNADRDNSLTRDVQEFKQTGTVTINKRKVGNHFVQRQVRPFNNTTPLNRPGPAAGFKAAGGVLDLIVLVLKFVAIDRQMREIAEYYADKERLQKQLTRQRYRVIPPKPARIRAAIKAILATGSRTTDPTRTQQIQTALSHLRRALEESQAAWPGQ